jgi:hypothetical protein
LGRARFFFFASFRARHEDVLVTTLLDAARAGQTWPSLSDIVDLLRGAARSRWREDTGSERQAVFVQGLDAAGLLVALLALLRATSFVFTGLHWLGHHDWRLQGILYAQLSHALLWLAFAILAVVFVATRSRFIAVALVSSLGLHLLALPLHRDYPQVTTTEPLLAMLVGLILCGQIMRPARRLFTAPTRLVLTGWFVWTALLFVRWEIGYHAVLPLAWLALCASAVVALVWALLDPRMTVAVCLFAVVATGAMHASWLLPVGIIAMSIAVLRLRFVAST